jgi:hypothetical protein
MEAPPVIAPARPRFPWLLAGGLLIAATAVGVVFFLFDPSQYNFYPRCMLYATTGILCPGCGSQRALYHLFHGHLATALRCNLLFTLGFPVFALFFARFVARWAANGTMPATNVPARWIKLAVGGVIIFTILRNIPCAPFNYLAPP